MNTNTTIQRAKLADAPTIHRLANEIWWPTYEDYIPHGQISLMLELIYTETALKQQMESGQYFSFAMRNGDPVGFVGFQPKPSVKTIMRIEKIYVYPSEQGKGTGKLLIDHVSQAALAVNIHCLELNVNRSNPARAFYEKQGFVIVEEVDIPYYGYMLNDYIMQKQF
ncbi:GNAT family N-acetyltransferase [Parapedobacter tibetensis]|uniref:GNAT family N-acetyltransferase n=1 Tax=Parapedobacter tibetensis TaxID=2972951 RepID=UPI00214D947D|nr:GNAT family N-acetyltransferase [Parapedobacter tibetensis]